MTLQGFFLISVPTSNIPSRKNMPQYTNLCRPRTIIVPPLNFKLITITSYQLPSETYETPEALNELFKTFTCTCNKIFSIN